LFDEGFLDIFLVPPREYNELDEEFRLMLGDLLGGVFDAFFTTLKVVPAPMEVMVLEQGKKWERNG
jgi:hypothetical protein